MSEEREEVKAGLKKKTLRPLYPTLVEKGTMNILDGATRKQIDPSWPEQEVEVKDSKDRVLIRMHANFRRKVPKKEVMAQMIELATILEREGVAKENMVTEIYKLTPFSERHIRRMLPPRYKMVEHANIPTPVATQPPTGTAEATVAVVEGAARAEPRVQTPVKEVSKCPGCGSELKTVICSHCYREFPVKEILK